MPVPPARKKRRRALESAATLASALDHAGPQLLAGADPFERSRAICTLRAASPALWQSVLSWKRQELGWRHTGGAPLSLHAARSFFVRHGAPVHVHLASSMATAELLAPLELEQLLSLECLGTLLSDEDISRLAPRFTKLRALRLTHCTSGITVKSLRCLGARCPLLREVRVSHVDVERNVEHLRLSACLSPHVPALLLDLRTEGARPLAQDFCILCPARCLRGEKKGDEEEERGARPGAWRGCAGPFGADARLEVSGHLEGACGRAPHLLSLPKRRDVRFQELTSSQALEALAAVRRGRQLVRDALRRFPLGFRILTVAVADDLLCPPPPRWEFRHALEVACTGSA